MIRIERTNSDSPTFRALTDKLDMELKKLYGSSQEEFDQFNIVSGINTVVIVYFDKQPAGCGCFKEITTDTVELKRMYVDTPFRGRGIGAMILRELEQWAREKKIQFIILETGTIQPDAIRLYKKQGYQVIPNFAPYIGNELSICFNKILSG